MPRKKSVPDHAPVESPSQSPVQVVESPSQAVESPSSQAVESPSQVVESPVQAVEVAPPMPVTNRAVVEDTLRVIRKTHSYIAGQKMTLAEWQDSVECLYWLDSMEARLVEDLAKEA